MSSHSPHHSQTTPISQSPPPASISSPYTNLPHQSPTGSAGYATPAPPSQHSRQSSSSCKSPGRAGASSRSSQQQQQHQLSSQQQAALYHAHGYGMYTDLTSKQAVHARSHDQYLHHMASANAAMAYYSPQAQQAAAMSAAGMQVPAVPGHTGHGQSHTSSLSKLQQLTMSQGIMVLQNQSAAAAVPQTHVSHTPPPQVKSKSSKNRSSTAGSSAAAASNSPAAHLALPYHMPQHYPGQNVGQARSSAAQPPSRPPNVSLPALSSPQLMQ